MSVKIRLKQTGKRNSRSFRIVAVDEAKKRDGKVIETLGFFQATNAKGTTAINKDRIEYWVKAGGVMTGAVAKLVKRP